MKTSRAPEFYTLAFGLFLGLCLWKFGNPVVLDPKIPVPVTAADFFNEPWPPHWADWLLLPLVVLGAGLALQNKIPRPQFSWLGRHVFGKSGGGPPQSKTLRVRERHDHSRQRLGLRPPSGALVRAKQRVPVFA